MLAKPLETGSAPLPPCWPSNFGGTGTLLYSGITEKGNWHGWWCPVDGLWRGYGVVTTNEWLLIHPREPRGTLQKMAEAYWRLNVFEPATPALKDLQAEMWSTLNKYPPQDPVPKPPPPPAPVWRVTANGTATTRPAYLVKAGVIGTRVTGHAPVGEPCDCVARQIKRGNVTYCAAPAPLQELVTVCQQ